MKRVTGIGGVFFKAQKPKELAQWYEKHLGVEVEAQHHSATYRWRHLDDPNRLGATVWSIFPENTTYFGSKDTDVMINYRVEDLNAVLAELKNEGVQVAGEIEENEYGRFAWILDLEGNRIELWQAPDNY